MKERVKSDFDWKANTANQKVLEKEELGESP